MSVGKDDITEAAGEEALKHGSSAGNSAHSTGMAMLGHICSYKPGSGQPSKEATPS